jgi:glucokinase
MTNARPVIGVDLGGTKVAVASLSERSLSESLIHPTEKRSGAALIDQIVSMVKSLADGQLQAVGVGIPSVVEFATGRAVSSVNVPLANVPLRQVLAERLGVPVFVDNDATVAAFAESHDENCIPIVRNLVMLTVGTGLGGGLVLGGRIYRGSTGGAAELGHTIVGLDLAGSVPAPMGFPQPGSLEFVASGRALDRLAGQSALLHPGSALARVHAEGKPVLGPDAVQAARDGDSAAARIVEIWGERIGIGVANAVNTFDPDEVVIGGGAAQAAELLLAPATRIARGYILPGLGAGTTIRLARHGPHAGVLGAALVAEQELREAS